MNIIAIVKENSIVLKPFDLVSTNRVVVDVTGFLYMDESGIEQTGWGVTLFMSIESGGQGTEILLETQICDPDMEVAAYLGYTHACAVFGSMMDNTIMVTGTDGELVTEIDADNLVEFMESCTCDEDQE